MEIKCNGHVKIQLLLCVYDTADSLYSLTKYTFCNKCAIKMGEKETILNKKEIPDLRNGIITKVICNILVNGYEYAWFGHQEDRAFHEDHGDKWE